MYTKEPNNSAWKFSYLQNYLAPSRMYVHGHVDMLSTKIKILPFAQQLSPVGKSYREPHLHNRALRCSRPRHCILALPYQIYELILYLGCVSVAIAWGLFGLLDLHLWSVFRCMGLSDWQRHTGFSGTHWSEPIILCGKWNALRVVFSVGKVNGF